MNILEYHRPKTLEQALELLGRDGPPALPIGGGSALNRSATASGAAPGVIVVDLQGLGLDRMVVQGGNLVLGATLTLQRLLDALKGKGSADNGANGLSEGLSESLARAIEHETAYNLRQAGTVAGALVAADGRSPFATTLLALDTTLTLLPGDQVLNIGDLLPLRGEKLRGRLITQVSLPTNVRLYYDQVARTPYDRPVVCVAVAVWPSGRVRVALGGYGTCPSLAFDGTEAQGAATAARSAYSQAEDEWASAAYRQETAETLVQRILV